MGGVSMKMDTRDFNRMLLRMDNVHEAAVSASMNRGLAKARTAAKREIASEADIQPQRLVSRRMRIKRATKARLNGALRILTNPIPAIKLGAKDLYHEGARTGKGVTARGGRHWRDAFIRPGKGANWQVFERRAASRLPLRAIKIPIKDIAERKIKEKVEDARDWIAKEIPRQIMWRVAKRG